MKSAIIEAAEELERQAEGLFDCGDGEAYKARLLSLAQRLRAETSGWNPIETAPTDTSILVCQSVNRIIATARGVNKFGNWSTGPGAMDYIAGATHWMPLPEPPAVKDSLTAEKSSVIRAPQRGGG